MLRLHRRVSSRGILLTFVLGLVVCSIASSVIYADGADLWPEDKGFKLSANEGSPSSDSSDLGSNNTDCNGDISKPCCFQESSSSKFDSVKFLSLLFEGRFEQAELLLESCKDPDLAVLKDSISRFLTVLEESQRKKRARYAELLKEAEKFKDEANIEKAISSIRQASLYIEDEKRLAELEIVKQIKALAEKKAEEYFTSGDWLKAGNIYAELSSIWPEDTMYKEYADICAKHIRLENFYREDSDWKLLLEGIRIESVPEVCYHVDQFYVEKPNFLKMTLAGLDTFKAFVELPKLYKTFPDLEKEQLRSEFVTGLKRLKEQVIKQSEGAAFDKKHLWQAFFRLLVLNQDTIRLPDELVVREFTDSALSELDPFTSVIWPSEVSDFAKHTTGKFSGVGIQITMENNRIKVVTPIPGTPAYRAGIMPGDYIVSINGRSAEGITLEEAVRRITGPKGTKVRLGILHPYSDKPVEIELIRDTIVIHTVKGYRLDENNHWEYFVDPAEKIAYIRITSFTDTTVPDLKDALDKIKAASARALILDLRFNPGGTLNAAVETVDLFIDKGLTIVSTKGRSARPWQAVSREDKYISIPVVVLINSFSASASEIVSGALRDYKRAVIVGERSFGKGSVQNVIGIVDDTCKLKITTAYYYLPSGRCIHRKETENNGEWGVKPDLEIKLSPDELKDVVEIQRDSEIIRPINGGGVNGSRLEPPSRLDSNTKADKEMHNTIDSNKSDMHNTDDTHKTYKEKLPTSLPGKKDSKSLPSEERMDLQLMAAELLLKLQLKLGLKLAAYLD